PVADARQPVDSVLPNACSMGDASSSEVISTRAIRSRSRQRSGIGVAATGEGETMLLRIKAPKVPPQAYPIMGRRFRTLAKPRLNSCLHFGARVEEVAEGVADEVEGEHAE